MAPQADITKPFIANLCNLGSHEGQPKTYHNGENMPTCKGEYGGFGLGGQTFGKLVLCTCKCHDVFRMARKEFGIDMTPGLPRVPSSIPSATVDGSLASPVHNDTPRFAEPIRVPRVKEYKPTPSGYRPPGLLEDQVLETVIALRTIGNIDITPRVVADFIDAENPPSTGAITAVFDRWHKLEFADVAQKPTRLLNIIEGGDAQVLQRLKDEAKRKDRMQSTRIRRGF